MSDTHWHISLYGHVGAPNLPPIALVMRSAEEAKRRQQQRNDALVYLKTVKVKR